MLVGALRGPPSTDGMMLSREGAGRGHRKITSVLGACRSPVPSLLCDHVQGGWLHWALATSSDNNQLIDSAIHSTPVY